MTDTNQTHEPELLIDEMRLSTRQQTAVTKDSDLERRLAGSAFTTGMYRELIANNLPKFSAMYNQGADLYGHNFLVYSNPSKEAIAVFSFFNLDRVLSDPSQHHDEIKKLDQWLMSLPNPEVLAL